MWASWGTGLGWAKCYRASQVERASWAVVPEPDPTASSDTSGTDAGGGRLKKCWVLEEVDSKQGAGGHSRDALGT